MSKRIDLAGQTIGGCLCLSATDTWGTWVWKCHCSNTFEQTGHAMKTAFSRHGNPSCGCVATAAKAQNGRNNKTHGRTRGRDRRLYDVWRQMHRRCEDPTCKDYPAYGARGIIVCDKWFDVGTFCDWAWRAGYQYGLTIERENTNGNYEPGNCRWIPMVEQAQNLRKNVNLTHDGKTLSASAWSRVTGIHVQTILQRHRKGWPDAKILTLEPILGRNQTSVL